MSDAIQVIGNGGRNEDGSPRTLSRWTFEYGPAREIVEDYIHGPDGYRVLNACAGRTKLDTPVEVVRNDLNPDIDADLHVDVAEIDEHVVGTFDAIIFDPPFDEKQAEDKYDGMHAGDMYAALESFRSLSHMSTVVLCFGWNSWGMQSFDEFDREEIYLLQRGPCLRDVIVTVDRRNSGTLGDVYT